VRFVVTLRDGRAAGTETEALIDADPEAPLAGLLPQLLHALDDDSDPRPGTAISLWVDGVAVTADQHTLRSAALRPGSVVELHAHEEQPALSLSGVAELRVVNGPGAGRVHRLGLGRTIVGHDAPGLSLPDTELAADALTVTARPGGAVEVSPAPGTSVLIDGIELDGPSTWPIGGYLTTGESVLELSTVSDPDADVREIPDGLGMEIVRHPRSTRTRPAAHFVLPARPTQTRAVAGRDYRRQLAQWRDDRVTARAEVLEMLARETRDRRDATPDPAMTLLTAVGPGRRLWERLPLDDDWLQLRLGLAAQPPRTVIDDLDVAAPVRTGRTRWHNSAPEPLPVLLPDVPVTLNLQAVGLLGIVGHASTADATARWLLAQCATFHSPRELRIAVLTGHDYAARRRWEWVSRLPHARPDESSGVTALIGNDRESIEHRLAELGGLLTERTQQRLPGGTRIPSSPEVIVVLDGVRRLSSADGVAALMAHGPAAGVHMICLDADQSALPEQCRAVVTCTPGRLTFRRSESPALDGVRPDLVEPAWAERISRALAPLRLEAEAAAPQTPTPVGEPRAWAIGWDDAGYPAPTR
jgi:S-DNA-T family DNA segregation ATPase FtsK/SpoIIIE